MTVVDFLVSCLSNSSQNAGTAADVHSLSRCSIGLCDEHGYNVPRLHFELTVVVNSTGHPACEYPISDSVNARCNRTNLSNISLGRPSWSVFLNLSSFIQFSPCWRILRALVEPPEVSPMHACSVALFI